MPLDSINKQRIMAIPSRFQKFKNIIEILGIISVIISLILLWQETRQNRILSEISFEMTITQNRIIANQTITNHAEVWIRGCANDSLGPEEIVIFKAMVEDKNELAFYRVARYLMLDDDESANVIEADFVGFLHRNPGARKFWKNNEEINISNRRALEVELVDSWYENINRGLTKLDNVNFQR